MTDASGSNQPTDPTAAAPVPPAPQPPRKKVPLAVKIIAPVLGVIVGIGVYAGVRAAFDAAAGPSKQMLIEKAVDQALDAFDPPRQIDEVTVLTDVTAEQNAIHYHYTLVDVDPSAVTQEALEGIVLPTLCGTKQTRQVLDQDVSMKYTYTVESTGDEYALEFVKGDC